MVWLPGTTEVQVAGETFHQAAITAAQFGTRPDGGLIAVLVPEAPVLPGSNAVAVYVQGGHVGYLPSEVAARVGPRIRAFGSSQGGRFISCPARIHLHSVGPQVVLMLDTTPLGLPAEAFETVPELAATLIGLLAKLREPAPQLTGVHVEARRKLGAWRSAESSLRSIIGQFAAAGDPTIAEACSLLAQTLRYQPGHRDETLTAYVDALYYRRLDADLWRDLLDYASSAPHIPMLTELFAISPSPVRPALLPLLVSISDGRGRMGNLDPAKGPRLRAALLEIAEDQDDRMSIAYLCADAGHRAEKAGDLPGAVMAWRAAVAAGSTDAKTADRLTTWLVKQGEYAEAAHVLRQALTRPPAGVTLRQRLEKRLARCGKAPD
ncbi:HIRAN domain-containing protein [Nonomuraea sp. NPDC049504]|uniref:HIRAN domain-containing protein n=1 Tax=Nonomuraea sp. NPDC049504 TaxID=3154729 RepID=UPI003429559B